MVNRSFVDAVSHATCDLALDVNAKAIVVSSLSGVTVRMISRFRSPVDILGVTTSEKVWYKLALSWGVTPAITGHFDHTTPMFNNALNLARMTFNLSKGDYVILTGGNAGAKKTSTNLIKLEIA